MKRLLNFFGLSLDKKSRELRAMTDSELAEYMSGWKEGNSNWWLAQMEFKRREQSAGRLISVLALVVSAVALFK